METIGKRIKYRRKTLNLTIKDISNATGISSGNLSEIENGKYLPGLKKMEQLCIILECSADWLIFGKNELVKPRIEEKIKISVTDKMILNLFHKLSENNQILIIDNIEEMLNKQ